MRLRITKIAPFLMGVLVAPSLYLNIAMGTGRVPYAALNYSILIALVVIPLAFFSATKEYELNGFSFLIGGLNLVFTILAVFSIAFLAGLPGTDWIVSGEASANAAFIIATIMTIRNYKTLPFIVTGFAISIIFTFASVHKITKTSVDFEIQKTLKSGGCVLVTHNQSASRLRKNYAVYNVKDIPFGFVIGHNSPRIQFVTRSSSSKWTYGNMKTIPSRADFKECLNKYKAK